MMKKLKRTLRRKGFLRRNKKAHMTYDYDYDHMSNPFSNKFWERYSKRTRNNVAFAAFMDNLRY